MNTAGKYNFINTKGELLWNKPVNKWFDGVGYFYNGYAVVKINNKYNFISTNGEFLYNKHVDEWFDVIEEFIDCYNGYVRVKLKGKWNFINSNGKLLWDKPVDEWFDVMYNFHDGYAKVSLNDKVYYLRSDGVLCDYDTDSDTKEPLENQTK